MAPPLEPGVETPDPANHDLEQIQRWMQSVIMHPGGVVAGIDSAEARRHIDVAPADVEAVIAPSLAQSSVDRLAIYARAYYARLVECLQAEFPVMIAALGAELFDEFAIAYLQKYPSRSYTLDHLGRDFAAYLAETRRASGGESDSWLDFLADLARLEWHIAEVFDGLGVEHQPLLEVDQLLSIPPERWPAARLIAAPCLRLMRFDFPIDEYYRALRDGQETEPPEPGEMFLAITRRDYVVRHYRLTPPQHAILAGLAAGEPVGAAVMRGAELVSDAEFDSFAGDLRAWFARWAAAGFFTAVAVDSCPGKI
jgi:hypothetical protein